MTPAKYYDSETAKIRAAPAVSQPIDTKAVVFRGGYDARDSLDEILCEGALKILLTAI